MNHIGSEMLAEFFYVFMLTIFNPLSFLTQIYLLPFECDVYSIKSVLQGFFWGGG